MSGEDMRHDVLALMRDAAREFVEGRFPHTDVINDERGLAARQTPAGGQIIQLIGG